MQPEEFRSAYESTPAPSPEADELERRQIIEFHGARLQWRLQQAFEDHRRRLQQPVAAGMNRPRLVKGKPQGFG